MWFNDPAGIARAQQGKCRDRMFAAPADELLVGIRPGAQGRQKRMRDFPTRTGGGG